MPAATPGNVIVRNIRAARNRADLDQSDVVERMRALGYTTWHRQTLSKTERGERRLLAEEILALAIVLQTSITALMAPTVDDEIVGFPSGANIDAASVYRSANGMNDGTIWWDGNEPRWDEGAAEHRVWPPVGMSASTGQRIRDLQEQVAKLQQQLEERA